MPTSDTVLIVVEARGLEGPPDEAQETSYSRRALQGYSRKKKGDA
jgi:hypothetical protein